MRSRSSTSPTAAGSSAGSSTISDESSEAGWFTLDEFPEPAFEGERQALAVLRSRA